MWKVTLKGIWAKKGRFLLTGVAVMLGVAFVSGTFVLTATITEYMPRPCMCPGVHRNCRFVTTHNLHHATIARRAKVGCGLYARAGAVSSWLRLWIAVR